MALWRLDQASGAEKRAWHCVGNVTYFMPILREGFRQMVREENGDDDEATLEDVYDEHHATCPAVLAPDQRRLVMWLGLLGAQLWRLDNLDAPPVQLAASGAASAS